MNAVNHLLNLERFNVTREIESYRDENIGAVLIDSDPSFQEIPQSVLDSLTVANQNNPYKFVDKKMLEFQPDDLFIEKSFPSAKEAENFILEVFDNFRVVDYSYCFDIIRKLKLFCSVTKAEGLNCRFEILSGDSCKRFHIDEVHSRLICTYAGPGTQLKNPESPSVMELSSGSAILVKGTEYPDFKLATLHRSPPIEDMNIKRFLFIVDVVK